MNRNAQYMVYGIVAGYLILLIYVILLNLRERKLRSELDRVRRMVEQNEKTEKRV